MEKYMKPAIEVIDVELEQAFLEGSNYPEFLGDTNGDDIYIQ